MKREADMDKPQIIPEQFECATEQMVRFRDMDAFGHVNNAVYFTYLENARVDYICKLGLMKPGSFDFPFLLADIQLSYLAPLRLGEKAVTLTRCTHIGGSSFHFEYAIIRKDDSEVIAVGRSVQVSYDFVLGRTVPIADEMRAALEKAKASRRMPRSECDCC